ncbi:MAG: anti-sigma factor domain-containing protein [Pyrinomonadaceae bacterium]
MKHEDYQEMLAPAALDALDENERRTLDAHLDEGDDECRAELNLLGHAAASLVYTLAPAHAAPELRERILARIKSQPQDERPVGSSNGATTTTPAAAAANTSSNVIPLNAAARRQAREVVVSRRVLLFGSLAASIAVAALALTLAMVWQRNIQLQQRSARLQSDIAQLSGTFNQTQAELARARSDRELLAAPEASTATLSGTKVAEQARARLTYDERTGRALLVASALPPAPAGKAYQLWFIAAGQPPIPGSVFMTDASGRAELYETIPSAGRHNVIFAVTLEPASGVDAPTGDMYLKSSAS